MGYLGAEGRESVMPPPPVKLVARPYAPASAADCLRQALASIGPICIWCSSSSQPV